MDPWSAAIWLAGRPLLPAGKGGLILIAGGLVMVTVAMVWLSVAPPALRVNTRPAPSRSRVALSEPPRGHTRKTLAQRPPRPALASSKPIVIGDAWSESMADLARACGCKDVRLVATNGKRCRIMVAHDGHHCRQEKRAMKEAARRVGKHAHVKEIHRGRQCLYEIRLGRR